MILRLSVATTLLAIAPSALSDPRFSYAGIDVETTIQAARERFPNSDVEGNYIRVSIADSQRLIRYVSIEKDRIRLGLGTRTVGDTIKPGCFDVYDRLSETYGKADTIRKNVRDGPAILRVYLWTHGDERMELQCEDLGRQLNADRIELYRSSTGAT
jgi:hypothetical protein